MAILSVVELTSIDNLLALLGLLFLYMISVITYRVYFHPLAKFPGPFLGKFSEIIMWKSIVLYDRTLRQHDLLEKYGSPVRISTNLLVFADMKSWTDIYGQSLNPCTKDPKIYNAFTATGAVNIFNAVDRGQHARLRRLLSHSFSLKTILQSEPLIASKVEDFVTHIFAGPSQKEVPVDIYDAIHEHYLDIISHLFFGESFNCLKEEDSKRFHDVDQFLTVVPATSMFPGIKYLPIATLQEGYRGLNRLIQFSRSAVVDFLESLEKEGGTGNGTVLEKLAVARDEETGSKLSVDEMVENAILFLVGGSGTTAVTTTYFIWECGRRPDIRKKLVDEIRNAFPDPDSMPTYEKASQLPYLNAMIEEILRLWGPVNVNAFRISPGRVLGDCFVPKGTTVSVLPYTTARDAQVFPEPDVCRPERWLHAISDMKNMSRPFLTGPRNCLGRHLAMVQLTLTLTRLYQLFDVVADASMTPEKMKLRDRGLMEPWGASLLVSATRAH